MFTQIWVAHIPLKKPIGDGRLRLDGSRGEVEAFSWFALGLFAAAGGEPAGRAA